MQLETLMQPQDPACPDHAGVAEALRFWHQHQKFNGLSPQILAQQIPGQPTCASIVDIRSDNPPEFINIETVTIAPFYDCDTKNRAFAQYPDLKHKESAVYPYYAETRRNNNIQIHLIRKKVASNIIQYHRMILPDMGNKLLLTLCWVGYCVTAEPVYSTPITGRERACLMLVSNGYSSKQIAHRLGITARTVEHHLSAAKRKMRARNVAHAVSLLLLQQMTQPSNTVQTR